MNRDQLIEWMDKTGRTAQWLAKKCGVKVSTVSSWRSNRPVPAKAVVIIKQLMREDEIKEKAAQALPQNLLIEFPLESFREVEKAALKKGKTASDWALETLNNGVFLDRLLFELRDNSRDLSTVRTIKEALSKIGVKPDRDLIKTIQETAQKRAMAGDQEPVYYDFTGSKGGNVAERSHIMAAAGPGIMVEVIEWEGADDSVKVKIVGSSMEPLFQDEEVITMTHKRASRSPFMRKGVIYLVEYDGGWMVKEYGTRPARPEEVDAEYLTDSGSVGILKSRNPDFPPIDITTGPIEWAAWIEDSQKK